jgi:hypothetical protein
MAQKDSWPKWPAPGETTLASSATTQDDDTKRALLAEYGEHGAWARHFSGVRMTLGTFFLTASIGIMYQRWDNFDPKTATLAGMALIIGIVLFVYFSWLTFKYVNRQRAIAEDYQTKLCPELQKRPKPIPFLKRDVLLIVIGAVVFFVVVFVLWSQAGPPNPLLRQ